MSFFSCRSCASPFASFFGIRGSDDNTAAVETTTSIPVSGAPSAPPNRSFPNAALQQDLRVESNPNDDNKEIRSPDEIATLCQSWELYAHPRAKEYWETSEALQELLRSIAKNISRQDDPVLGDEASCVVWHGELSERERAPICYLTKPGDSLPTPTYVTRALAMLFADETSFNALQTMKPIAFPMDCGNPQCVNLTHISLEG